jgi:ATP-dependent Clp protease adaptor protein ClpS
MELFNAKTDEKVKTKKPSMYNVFIYNDDVTDVRFVEAILSEIFKKDKNEMQVIIDATQREGKALVGVYIRDVAVTRCNIAMQLAKENRFPLKLKWEMV